MTIYSYRKINSYCRTTPYLKIKNLPLPVPLSTEERAQQASITSHGQGMEEEKSQQGCLPAAHDVAGIAARCITCLGHRIYRKEYV